MRWAICCSTTLRTGTALRPPRLGQLWPNNVVALVRLVRAALPAARADCVRDVHRLDTDHLDGRRCTALDRDPARVGWSEQLSAAGCPVLPVRRAGDE